MSGTSTLLFLKVLCDIERKKVETLSEVQDKSVSSVDDNPENEPVLKLYMQEKYGEGGSLGSKRYACHKCSCLFRRKRHLRRHLNICCSHKCLGCSECSAEIINRYHGLLGEAETSRRAFSCLSCKLRFCTQAGLAIHQEFHPQPGRLLQCGSCSQRFTNRLDLDSHQKIHITSEVHKCTSCSKAFTTSSNLAKHRQSRHEKRSEPLGEHFLSPLAASEEHDSSLTFACDLCLVVGSNESELKDHIIRHFVDGEIRCLECSKLFKQKNELSEHMHVHRVKVVKKKRRKLYKLEENAIPTGIQQVSECLNCLSGVKCDEHQEDPLAGDDPKSCSLCFQTFRCPLYNFVHICRKFPPVEDLDEEALAENGFCCPACSKQFSSIIPLKMHFEVHKGGEPQHCQLCDRRFSSVRRLDAHLEVHGKNTCTKCGIFFNTKLALLLHGCGITMAHFTCSTCGEQFSSKFTYRKHCHIHPESREPKFQCPECKAMFLKESNFRAHYIVHTGTYPFACRLCDEKFLTFGPFKKHSLEHLCNKIIQCEECDQIFSSQQKFTIHSKLHQHKTENEVIKKEENVNAAKSTQQYKPLKAQECPHCGMVFRREYQLLIHKDRVHDEKSPYSHVCELCSRGFYFKQHFDSHFECCSQYSEEERKKLMDKVAHAEANKIAPGPFPCSVCGKMYLTQTGLNIHSFVHRDDSEYPYNCSLCGHGFVKEHYHKCHEAKCKGLTENVIKCEICGATFKTGRMYKRHKKGHARELSCEVCGEKFITNQGLTKHSKACSPQSFNARLLRQQAKGHKRYRCPKCDRLFTLKNRFLVHLGSHEGKIPYECKQCKQRFLSKSNLTRHKCKVDSDPLKL